MTKTRKLKRIEDLKIAQFECPLCGEMKSWRVDGPDDFQICVDCNELRRPESDEKLQCELCKGFIQIGEHYQQTDMDGHTSTVCQPCIIHLMMNPSIRRE